MPVKDCQENGKPGYKYGDSGKCYTYTPNDAIERNKAKDKQSFKVLLLVSMLKLVKEVELKK